MDAFQPDFTEAEFYLERLCGDHRCTMTWQVFDDAKAKRVRGQVLHGPFHQYAKQLAALNRNGAGIYVMVNPGDGITREGQKSCRTEDNVVAIRALFVDDDEDQLKTTDFVRKPDLVVQSKNGIHAYWLTGGNYAEGDFKNTFRAAQKGLAALYKTDSSISDPCRVMRVPGFYHMKTPAEPFMVRVVRDV